MSTRDSRYFLALFAGVWHLILHSLTCPTKDVPRTDGPGRADGGPMKITPWYLAALAPFAALGYSGAYLGHAAVVVLTLGIFLGTLSLGRTSAAAGTAVRSAAPPGGTDPHATPAAETAPVAKRS